METGKHLFETLVADDRAGRHRSLSARGAASLAMHLASIREQPSRARASTASNEAVETMTRVGRDGKQRVYRKRRER